MGFYNEWVYCPVHGKVHYIQAADNKAYCVKCGKRSSFFPPGTAVKIPMGITPRARADKVFNLRDARKVSDAEIKGFDPSKIDG